MSWLGVNIAKGDYKATFTQPMGKPLSNTAMGLCIAGRVAFWFTGVGALVELGIMAACYRNRQINATHNPDCQTAAAVAAIADNLKYTASTSESVKLRFDALSDQEQVISKPVDRGFIASDKGSDGKELTYASENAVFGAFSGLKSHKEYYTYVNAHTIDVNNYKATAGHYPVDPDGDKGKGQVEPFLRALYESDSTAIVDLTSDQQTEFTKFYPKNYYETQIGSVKVSSPYDNVPIVVGSETIGYKQTLRIFVEGQQNYKTIIRYHFDNVGENGIPPALLSKIVNELKDEKVTIQDKKGLGPTFVVLGALMLQKNLSSLNSSNYQDFIDQSLIQYRAQRSPAVLQSEAELASLYNYVEYQKNPALFNPN